MDDRARISVPLHKIIAWQVECKCGGRAQIGSGVLDAVETARCPACRADLPMTDVLPVLKAARKLSLDRDKGCNLHMVTMLDRCDELWSPAGTPSQRG